MRGVSMVEAEREAERSVNGPATALLDRLAGRLGAHANASAVYGEPVEHGDVVVIPVAKVRWGFGGGGGRGKNKDNDGEGSGEGGGGGMTASPLGFIEIRNNEAEFKPIKDPGVLLLVPPIIIAGGITAMLVLRGLRRLIRD